MEPISSADTTPPAGRRHGSLRPRARFALPVVLVVAFAPGCGNDGQAVKSDDPTVTSVPSPVMSNPPPPATGTGVAVNPPPTTGTAPPGVVANPPPPTTSGPPAVMSNPPPPTR